MTTLELLGNQLVIRLSTALSLSLGVALLLLVIAVTVLAELTAVQQYKQSAAVTKLECILVMLIAVMLFMQLNTTSSTTS